MQRAAEKLERLFMLLLFINPFLDILGGVYSIYLQTNLGLPDVSPSLLVRMLVLVLFAVYILMRRDWKAVLIIAPIGAVWLLSFLVEAYFFYSIDFTTDLTYMVRFIFNIAAILVYSNVFRRSKLTKQELMAQINRALVFTVVVISAAIILPYILEIGLKTYGNIFGYFGSKGFFNSGNDITAVLMLLLPLSLSIFFMLPEGSGRGKYVYTAAAPAGAILSLALLGTKTAYMAIAAVAIAFLAYALYYLFKKKTRRYLVRFIVVILASAILFGLIFLANADLINDLSRSVGMFASVGSNSDSATAFLLSGRQYKLNRVMGVWKDTMPLAVLFGIGRGTQTFVIEMDIFEVVFYYGLVGAVVMLWLYVKLGAGFVVRFFKSFFKTLDLTGMALLISIGLCAGYMLLAGHVLFSVTSGFYFAFMLVYAHLHYSATPQELKLY